jgi:hypothetical protein
LRKKITIWKKFSITQVAFSQKSDTELGAALFSVQNDFYSTLLIGTVILLH